MRTTAVLLFVVLVAGCNRNDSEPAQPVASLSKETPQLQSPVTLPARFSSWSLSCEGAQDVKDLTSKRCAISQIVTTNPKSAKVLLGVTVDYRDSPSVPTIHFRFSPTARVAPGVGIKIDELAEMRLPISDCNAQRCEASGRLVPDVLKLWQSGRLAQVAFIAENDKQVTLPVSLDGFPMAIAALNEQYRAVR